MDYTLREPKDAQALTVIAYTGPYDSREIDVDGYRSSRDKRVGIAAGASYRRSVDLPGFTARIASLGILPQWTPNKDFSIRMFWGRSNVTDARTMPAIYLGAYQTPPQVSKHYFGQTWAETDYQSDHYGIIVKAGGAHWSMRAGFFRSTLDLPRGYADLYLNTLSNGIGSHTIVAEPDQSYGSTSGEIELSHILVGASWKQELDFGARGRDVTSHYGGSDAVDFGIALAGQLKPLVLPNYSFRAGVVDHIDEYSVATSYTFQWNKHLDFTAGVQRPSYSRDIADPVLGRSTTLVRPWLYNSSLVLHPTERLVLFGTLTRGLEDSGVAPSNAVNRGAVLGIARSSQAEVGVKYTPAKSLTFVTAVFDIEKPYFALDAHNVFDSLGRERHRGVEISLAGEVVPGLNVVAGEMLLSPEVIATSSEESIGRTPVGQPRRIEQLSIDYRIPHLPGVSVDCSLAARGARMARTDNSVQISGYSTLDLGARYLMSIGHHTTTLRVQVLNVTDSANWYVGNDGGLLPIEPRRALAYLILDL